MVPATGLEPVRCYSLEPESSASANSATRALWQVHSRTLALVRKVESNPPQWFGLRTSSRRMRPALNSRAMRFAQTKSMLQTIIRIRTNTRNTLQSALVDDGPTGYIGPNETSAGSGGEADRSRSPKRDFGQQSPLQARAAFLKNWNWDTV